MPVVSVKIVATGGLKLHDSPEYGAEQLHFQTGIKT